jgi:hypothetical protein
MPDVSGLEEYAQSLSRMAERVEMLDKFVKDHGSDPDFEEQLSKLTGVNVKGRLRKLPLFDDKDLARAAGSSEQPYDIISIIEAMSDYVFEDK